MSEEVFDGVFDTWFKVNEDEYEYITRADGVVMRHRGGDYDSVEVKGMYLLTGEKKIVTGVESDHVPVFLLLARVLTDLGLIKTENKLLFEPERKIFCFVESSYPDGMFGSRKRTICDRDNHKTKRHLKKSDIALFVEAVKRYVSGDEEKIRSHEIVEEVEW